MVCVINEAFAKKYFEGRNPLGKHITDEYADKRFVFEIVGVAKNSRDHSLKKEIPPRFFLAVQQGIIEGEVSPFVIYEVRSTLAGGAATSALRQAAQSVDLNLKPEIGPLSRSLERQVGQERLIAKLVAFFGALALCLAAIGIYGILAYGVSQRTNEIGIRMAIGAEAGDVVSMIAKETVAMVLIGLSSGLVAAYFITKLIQNRLFGVTSTDPLVLATAIGLLALIAMLAGMLPAWRASRIDPAIALRYE
jgi:ABC-type antimicrobial peptide transport system permease subunit